MLNTAAASGKVKISVESPMFNPNVLFQEEGSLLKKKVGEIQISAGRVTHERWGDMTEIRAIDIHDQIRKLVLMAFFAKYNTDIQIDQRLRAKELYSKISELFLDTFQKSCFD